MTNKEAVLDFLRRHAKTWFSHAQLAQQLSLRHQVVFQTCRDLAQEEQIYRERAGAEWRVSYKGSATSQGVFDWIRDEGLRKVVLADWEEVGKSLSCGTWKATLVLSGACLEGVLIAALQTREDEVRKHLPEQFRRESIAKLPLRQLAIVAQRFGYLKPRLADFLIESRNLIHPATAARESAPSRDEAEAAVKLMEDCIRSFANALNK